MKKDNKTLEQKIRSVLLKENTEVNEASLKSLRSLLKGVRTQKPAAPKIKSVGGTPSSLSSPATEPSTTQKVADVVTSTPSSTTTNIGKALGAGGALGVYGASKLLGKDDSAQAATPKGEKPLPKDTPSSDTKPKTPTPSGTSSSTQDAWKSTFGDSSLGAHHDTVKAASEKHGVPFHVAAGIMAHETGRGTSKAWNTKNNPGGIMDPKTNWSKTKSYDSPEAGIDDAVRVMAKNYNAAGGDLQKMGQRYAPVGAANDPRNLNVHWHSGVSKYSSAFQPSETPKPEAPVKVAQADTTTTPEKESGPKKKSKMIEAVINELDRSKLNLMPRKPKSEIEDRTGEKPDAADEIKSLIKNIPEKPETPNERVASGFKTMSQTEYNVNRAKKSDRLDYDDEIKESVGILGSDKPKFDQPAFKKTFNIKPRDGHSDKKSKNVASARQVAKAGRAQPIKMEEMSTLGSPAGQAAIAFTPAESGPKKKMQKESGKVPNIFKESGEVPNQGNAEPTSKSYGSFEGGPSFSVVDHKVHGKVLAKNGKMHQANSYKEANNLADRFGGHEIYKNPINPSKWIVGMKQSHPAGDIKEEARDKQNVPRPSEKDRKKIEYVDRGNDPKTTKSKLARQAAYKTNIIDEQKENRNRIMREAVADAVADKTKSLKNKTVAIPTTNLNGQKDVTIVDFNPNLNKPNVGDRINEANISPAIKTAGKVAGAAAVPVGGYFDYSERREKGESPLRAAGGTIASAIGTVGGAAAGSLAAPVVGTVAGGLAGGYGASQAYDWAMDRIAGKVTPPNQSGTDPTKQQTPSGTRPPVQAPKGEGALGTRLAGQGVSREDRRSQEFVDKTLGAGKFKAGSAASNYALEKHFKEVGTKSPSGTTPPAGTAPEMRGPAAERPTDPKTGRPSAAIEPAVIQAQKNQAAGKTNAAGIAPTEPQAARNAAQAAAERQAASVSPRDSETGQRMPSGSTPPAGQPATGAQQAQQTRQEVQQATQSGDAAARQKALVGSGPSWSDIGSKIKGVFSSSSGQEEKESGPKKKKVSESTLVEAYLQRFGKNK